MFGKNPTEYCLIYNIIINSIYENQSHTLSNWNQPMLAPQQLQLYAEAMLVKEALLDLCAELVNGTFYQISRPKKVVNNKSKRAKMGTWAKISEHPPPKWYDRQSFKSIQRQMIRQFFVD